jgi:hypothetical protein
MNDSTLRKDLVELLEGHAAHVDPKRALADVKPSVRGTRPAPEVHSMWEELEHMRLAQEDILRYTLDASWTSPKWPEGYWPEPVEEVADEQWEASVAAFLRDLDEVRRIVEDPSVDLTAAIPHGEGRTYLREVLLVADHNAYHLGQLLQVRKLLGDWKS